MTLFLGAAFACWALLTLMGGERARRLHQLQAQRPAHVPPPPPSSPVPVISVPAEPVGIAAPAPRDKSKHAKAQAAVAKQNVR